MSAQIALGLSSSGVRRFEGDGNIHSGTSLDLTGELVGDGDAVTGRGADEIAQDAVVGVGSIRAEDGDQLPELLQQSEVALGGVGVARPHVDSSSANEVIEARVEDAVEHGQCAALGCAEELVVALKQVHASAPLLPGA